MLKRLHLLNICKENVLKKSCSSIQTTYDINYICNQQNIKEISQNILQRKGVGDIQLVHLLKNKLDTIDVNTIEFQETKTKFLEELYKLPNKTHPDVLQYENEPKIVKHVNLKRSFQFEPKEFYEITKRLNLVRTDQLGNVSGNKSYYFLGEMAQLEYALIQYTLDKLIKNGFSLISVPDILPRRIIENCGMNTRGDRTQVID